MNERTIGSRSKMDFWTLSELYRASESETCAPNSLQLATPILWSRSKDAASFTPNFTIPCWSPPLWPFERISPDWLTPVGPLKKKWRQTKNFNDNYICDHDCHLRSIWRRPLAGNKSSRRCACRNFTGGDSASADIVQNDFRVSECRMLDAWTDSLNWLSGGRLDA